MNPIPVRLALLASGSGTNAEAIMRHFQHHPRISVALLLSNNASAYALERAKKIGVPVRVLSREEFRGEAILHWLKQVGVTHIVLAGFLWLVPSTWIAAFPDRIINIHPSLLPKHGGKGMYGNLVHGAVIDSGDRETGITIHLVTERFDEGRILFQAKCPVAKGDTAESVANKVHELEHQHFPIVIEKWASPPALSGGEGANMGKT